jgi:preprotein translocase subunit SecA
VGFLDDELEALLDQFLAGDAADEWNLEGLSAALLAMGLEGPGITEDALWEVGGREAIRGHLGDLVADKLDEKEREIGAADWTMIERLVLLRTIDSLWVEHLTEIDDMRRGIGLRGYAQQDPLNEFRREAFALYTELRDLIRHQLANTIFRVTVTRQSEPAPTEMPLPDEATLSALRDGDGAAGGARTGAAATRGARAGAAAVSGPLARGLPAEPSVMGVRESLGDEVIGGEGAAASGGLRPGYTPAGQRIGRNDACFCGSGLKYKKCHGR